eukprot:6214658-Pleurochrysis_carterae.AAC.2
MNLSVDSSGESPNVPPHRLLACTVYICACLILLASINGRQANDSTGKYSSILISAESALVQTKDKIINKTAYHFGLSYESKHASSHSIIHGLHQCTPINKIKVGASLHVILHVSMCVHGLRVDMCNG